MLGLRGFLVTCVGIGVATAAAGPRTEDLRPERLWVVDSEESLIGTVEQIRVRSDQVYILDGWLGKVLVLSSDGRILNSFGQTGEGPGEYRYPCNLLLLRDNHLGVVDRTPPKVAVLSPGGSPIEDLKLGPTSEQIWDARSAGDTIVVRSVERISGAERHDIVHRLRRCAIGTVEGTTYVEETIPLPPWGEMIVHETLPAGRWELGHNGHVYVSPSYERYYIQVFASDGSQLKPIARVYNHVELPAVEYEQRKKVYSDAGRRIGHYEEPSRYYRDIGAMFSRVDGTLWVQPSDGRPDPERGVLGTFDIFDEKQLYTRRVRIFAPYDPEEDQYFIAADRLFIVEHGLGAKRARSPGSRTEDAPNVDSEDLVALRIVCYALPLEPLARQETH